MKKFLDEVEQKLKSIKPLEKPSPWLAENYIGAGKSKLIYLNLKIPYVRKAFKDRFSFSKLTPHQQWKIWDYIWMHSQIFEVMLLASYWAGSQPTEDLVKNRKFLLGWLKRVDNWAHSDELSNHYSKMLEHDPRAFLPIFMKWSQSKNPWVKRQSMVGLLFYSRFRKQCLPYKTIIQIVEKHIDDDHYFVQKGVGWTLRECWNLYPKETYRYLKSNAHRIPSAGWTAATEKLSEHERTALKKLRQSQK